MSELKLKEFDQFPERFIAVWEYNGELWCDTFRKSDVAGMYEYYNSYLDDGEDCPDWIKTELFFTDYPYKIFVKE